MQQRAQDLLLFRLIRLATLAGRPLTRLCEGQYGITRREWRLLVILAQDGPQLSTALAQRASIVPARASRAIAAIAEKGLAVREPQPSDRRRVQVRLTDKGRSIYESLHPAVERMNAQLLEPLDVTERQILEAFVGRLEGQVAPLSASVSAFPNVNRRRMPRQPPA